MVKHFDHLTIVVRDIDQAKAFFSALGFAEAISVVISGEPFASYMGVPGIEAEHVTLVLENASPRTEIQLLRYHHPDRPLRANDDETNTCREFIGAAVVNGDRM